MKSVSGDHLAMTLQWHGYTGGLGWRFYYGFRRVLEANEGYKGRLLSASVWDFHQDPSSC